MEQTQVEHSILSKQELLLMEMRDALKENNRLLRKKTKMTYTVEEVARELHTSASAIRALIASDQLKAKKITKKRGIVVSKKALNNYLNS